jgi:potassium efflux system protein
MRKNLILLPCLLIVLLLTAATASYAQHKKSKAPLSVRDSLRLAVLKRDSLLRSFKHSDNSLNELLQKIEDYNGLYIQDNSDYTQGFDTLETSQELPSMERRMILMSNLLDNDRSSTLGYLFTIRDLVAHFKDNLDKWQNELSKDNLKLVKIHNDAGHFNKDTTMHTVPSDSSLRVNYLAQVLTIQTKWGKLDTAILKSLLKIGLLQNRVTALDLALLDINDRIDHKITDFSVRSLTNEYGFIWENDEQHLSKFDTVVLKTKWLNTKMLKYFFDFRTTNRVNLFSHCYVLSIFIAFAAWIFTSRRKLKRVKGNYLDTLNQTHYTATHAIVSSLLIALTLGIYLYDQPPFIFLEMLLLSMTLCLGILIKPVWPKPMFKFWIAIFVLTFFYAISNLFIQASYTDRLFLVLLSALSITAGCWFLKMSKNEADVYPAGAKLATKLFVIFNIISLLLNIFGRFSLSKIIGTSAIFGLDLAFGFYLMIQILMECLFLQLEANKSASSSFSSYIDFKIVQNKFKNVLIKVVAVLWVIDLLENLDIDDFVYDHVGDFLSHPYKFGTSAFTFGSIVIFAFVLWLSIIVSRVISYFYDYAEQQLGTSTDFKRNKTSMLLIRLSVFSVGFIAAIIFSGIPLTEITIVLGALGVGIGFGLQNIVNNLVSGVILAFEKPVQVGDIIEVGNRSGEIKEIGIRASKIETGEGSELIVPNGDLISQHVINWTLTNNNRRVELIVGAAYGSDVDKIDAILKRIIRGRKDVMQTPAPLVFMHNFSESSVDFRLLFWASDIGKYLSLKSSVMREIYTEFAHEGIEIPNPKRDIQVIFPEGSAEAKVQEAKETIDHAKPVKGADKKKV